MEWKHTKENAPLRVEYLQFNESGTQVLCLLSQKGWVCTALINKGERMCDGIIINTGSVLASLRIVNLWSWGWDGICDCNSTILESLLVVLQKYCGQLNLYYAIRIDIKILNHFTSLLGYIFDKDEKIKREKRKKWNRIKIWINMS